MYGDVCVCGCGCACVYVNDVCMYVYVCSRNLRVSMVVKTHKNHRGSA